MEPHTMTGNEGPSRDRQLRLWHPGPRRGGLREKGFLKKLPHVLYRKLNAETGLLGTIDQWLEQSLDAVHHTRERCVEYPFAYRELSVQPPATILIAGGARSALGYTLASLGYDVHVIDRDGYKLTHPNLTAYQGDLRELPFQDDFFDAIVCVSVIEHVGHQDNTTDLPERGAFDEFSRTLDPVGEIILTTPCAREPDLLPNGRVYSLARFQATLPSSLQIERQRTFSRSGETWCPCSADDLVTFDGRSISNVLCVTLTSARGV